MCIMTMVTMGPVGELENKSFFLEFSSLLFLTSGIPRKVLVGWWVVGVVGFLLVSSPGPGFVKVRTTFGRFGD